MNAPYRLCLFFMLFARITSAQKGIPEEIVQSVYLIRHGNYEGSCFLVSIDRHDYFITVRHLFPEEADFDTPVDIEIFKEERWIKVRPNILVHENPGIDIAVLDLGAGDLRASLFDVGGKDYYLSQECYFLGFPFGLKMSDKEGVVNSGYPMPFVKKGVISASVSDSTGMTQIFLDGHNNAGFSGGPVVVTNPGIGSRHPMRIIGVVSSYLNEEKIIKTPFGDIKNQENSGIILTYSTDHVFEIIKRKLIADNQGGHVLR